MKNQWRDKEDRRTKEGTERGVIGLHYLPIQELLLKAHNKSGMLLDVMREERPIKFLEIGVYFGDNGGALVSLMKPDSVYVGVDLFGEFKEKELYKEIFPKSIVNANMEEIKNYIHSHANEAVTIELRKGYSQEVLPNLIKEGYKFDYIFVDGGHAKETARMDIVNSLKLLTNSGRLFVHDVAEEGWEKDIRDVIYELGFDLKYSGTALVPRGYPIFTAEVIGING